MQLFLLATLLLGVPLISASENTGIRMTIRRVFAGNASEQIVFVRSDRKRTEFRNYEGRLSGPRLAAIIRCDLGQYLELNLDAAEYVSTPYPAKPLSSEEMEKRGLNKVTVSGRERPTLRIEVTTLDTGERKALFGRAARHVITTRKQIPLEGSLSEPQETVTDAWYIDLDTDVSCHPKLGQGKPGFAYLSIAGREQRENVEFVAKGQAETGFPVESVTMTRGTHTLPDGSKKEHSSQNEMQVTQLEEGPLDPNIFEIPSGFKQVRQIERNPSVPISTSSGRWEQFKAKLASLLNR